MRKNYLHEGKSICYHKLEKIKKLFQPTLHVHTIVGTGQHEMAFLAIRRCARRRVTHGCLKTAATKRVAVRYSITQALEHRHAHVFRPPACMMLIRLKHNRIHQTHLQQNPSGLGHGRTRFAICSGTHFNESKNGNTERAAADPAAQCICSIARKTNLPLCFHFGRKEILGSIRSATALDVGSGRYHKHGCTGATCFENVFCRIGSIAHVSHG